MKPEDVIRLAEEAGINYRALSDEFATGNGDGVEIEQMQAFAKLVAKHKREELAKKIEALPFGNTSASFAAWVREQE